MIHFIPRKVTKQPALLFSLAARVVGFAGSQGRGVPVPVRLLIYGLLALLLAAPPASAQFRVVPIQPFRTPNQAPATGRSVNATARTTALRLPFFDDFSTVTNRPDPALWQSDGNVYINNSLPINHPSVNVATFDGLNASGMPYDFAGTNAMGPTDTLTSQPIDLSGYSAADAIFLSFYWERKGLGEQPDATDSLRLQFLNFAGNWQTVWVQTGDTANNNFVQAFIPVTNSTFLHAGFQFRFGSFGRQSGAFDSWHVDYIYMNRGRSAEDRYIKDVACRRAVTPFLKRYTAMPLKQYLANPAAETADTIQTDIVNLFNNFNFTSFRFTVRDQLTGQVFQDYQQPASENIGALSAQAKIAQPQPLPASLAVERVALQSKFDVLTTDDQNPSIPTVNLRRNDTISGVTLLDNYYAFDDGTAEAAVQATQQQARIGMRFVLNKPDVVSGVRINLVPVVTDLTGKTFVISVWGNAQGRPGQALYQKQFTVKYPATRNGFVDFSFDYGVAVTDTFYVGWTQVSSTDILAVGFDKNSTFRNQILLNLGSSWDVSNLEGVPMIRPVIGGLATPPITGLEEPATTTPLRVYPNPNPGVLVWDNAALEQIDVMDLSGRLLMTARPANGQRQLNVTTLADGFYLVRLADGKRTTVQKIIIRK